MKFKQTDSAARAIHCVLLILALAAWAATAGAQCTTPCDSPECRESFPQISFSSTVCDLGEIGSGSRHTCEFKFTNSGSGRLEVTSMKSTCGCTVLDLPPGEYEPNECGTIKATYTASRAAGTARKHIYVSSNDKTNPVMRSKTVDAKAGPLPRRCLHVVHARRSRERAVADACIENGPSLGSQKGRPARNAILYILPIIPKSCTGVKDAPRRCAHAPVVGWPNP